MCRRSRCSWSSISTDRSFMSEELLYELREGIGVVTFNRPEARNALTFAMYEGLAEHCAREVHRRSGCERGGQQPDRAAPGGPSRAGTETGRATRRGRVCLAVVITVVAVSYKKK